eukprot:scaffold26011_cov24-Cyclotella_meneghiniana.AAC.2
MACLSVHCASSLLSDIRHASRVSLHAVISVEVKVKGTTSPSKTAANGSFFVHQVSAMRRLN